MAQKLSRRSILAGASTALGSTIVSLPGMASFERPLNAKKPKNIIFCVSDGMSISVPSMADQFMELSHGQSGIWLETARRHDIVKGTMDTRSLDSLVTDSAAASTAWGSGSLVMNGAICTLPGIELTPIYDVLGKAGMLRGLVTTATATHATPSGFASAVTSRNAQPDIAKQYRERGVEFVMGGGHEYFSADKRADKLDLYGLYAESGYAVAKTKSEMKAAMGAKKFLGIFNTGQMPFTVDYNNNKDIADRVPTLSEMSTFAIEHLKKGSKGFVLQIEGARIDHGAHANDFAALLYDQLEFEKAVKVALDFAAKDGETLVVITTDHGNANPGLTGNSNYGENNGLMMLHGMKSSYEAMDVQLKAIKSAADVQDLMLEKLSLKFTTNQAEWVLNAYSKSSHMFELGNGNYGSPTSMLAMAIGAHNGIGFTSDGHTSDWVEVLSYGPGSELFAGPIRNHTVFDKLMSLKDIKFSNPKLTLEEAKKAQAKLGVSEEEEHETAHWI
ncbi:MAG: alkaline phosphatase [Fimbriimonadaceae bacterium]